MHCSPLKCQMRCQRCVCVCVYHVPAPCACSTVPNCTHRLEVAVAQVVDDGNGVRVVLSLHRLPQCQRLAVQRTSLLELSLAVVAPSQAAHAVDGVNVVLTKHPTAVATEGHRQVR